MRCTVPTEESATNDARIFPCWFLYIVNTIYIGVIHMSENLFTFKINKFYQTKIGREVRESQIVINSACLNYI